MFKKGYIWSRIGLSSPRCADYAKVVPKNCAHYTNIKKSSPIRRYDRSHRISSDAQLPCRGPPWWALSVSLPCVYHSTCLCLMVSYVSLISLLHGLPCCPAPGSLPGCAWPWPVLLLCCTLGCCGAWLLWSALPCATWSALPCALAPLLLVACGVVCDVPGSMPALAPGGLFLMPPGVPL